MTLDVGEVLRTPLDQRKVGSGFPGEGFRDHAPHRPPGRSWVWGFVATEAYEPPVPVWGAFPKGFARVAVRALGVSPAEVLHLCSGALGREVGGVRVDIRQDARPDVRADARDLPFRDATFGGVLIDPPYSVEYAHELYGTDYPRPSHLLAEACRVVKANGRVGILHFLIPSSPPGLRILSVTGVQQGCGYRIRAFTLMVKEQGRLL
jgi:hypothetical protein